MPAPDGLPLHALAEENFAAAIVGAVTGLASTQSAWHFSSRVVSSCGSPAASLRNTVE